MVMHLLYSLSTKPLKFRFSVALLLLLAVFIAIQPAVDALTADERRRFSERGINFIDDPLPVCGAVGLGPTLDGHTLPAGFGGMGKEEPINERGQVPSSGGFVTFSRNVQNASTVANLPNPDYIPGVNNGEPEKVSLQELYREYYITMRWRYVLWNWNGSATSDGPESVDFYGRAPRILVTNPRTGKSIIAVVLEAGPAPWTGVDTYSNNAPKQGWTNPQDGTPASYKGRVSGFPPKAMEKLGATMRMYDGSGDDLVYEWADDQTATPGPVPSGGGAPSTQDPEAVNCPAVGVPDGEFFRDTSALSCPVGEDKGIADGYNSGKLYKIRLCRVQGFNVNVLIAQQLDQLLTQAKSEGINFGGGSFRTMDQQIALRREPKRLCGDQSLPITEDEVFNAPSNTCNPHTARPGYSNHQMGLAIDFTYNGEYFNSHSNPGFKWLEKNAARYGLKNYPPEGWHWSVNGN